MSGTCDKSDKSPKTSRPQTRGLQHPPTTLPTCYREQYPPGCTVLECRLEADRPVARVVQVLTDTATSSRMTSRLRDTKRQTASIEACSQGRAVDEVMLIAVPDVLESQECVGTPSDETPMATLETGKDKEQTEGTTSRTSYRSKQGALQVSHRDETSRSHPVTFIECAATSKSPPARIIQCPTNNAIQLSCMRKTPNCLEMSAVWFGDKCAADTQCSPARYSFDSRKSRARMSCDDKITRKLIDPAISDSDRRIKTDNRQQTLSELSKSAPCRKPKPKTVKCTQQPDPDVVAYTPFPRTARRNGLDSAEWPESSKRSLRDRVCSTAQHQPTEDSATLRSSTKEVCEDSFPIETRLTTSVRPDDQRGLRRPASEQMLGAEVARLESAKSNKASACRRSATASGRLIPRRVPEDTSRSLGSQESLARHEVYIPEYQLERYEACRSKRNGLQDECVIPFLRAAGAEEQRKERCIERERDIGKFDQRETRKSTCARRDQSMRAVFCLG